MVNDDDDGSMNNVDDEPRARDAVAACGDGTDALGFMKIAVPNLDCEQSLPLWESVFHNIFSSIRPTSCVRLIQETTV